MRYESVSINQAQRQPMHFVFPVSQVWYRLSSNLLKVVVAKTIPSLAQNKFFFPAHAVVHLLAAYNNFHFSFLCFLPARLPQL